MPDALAAARALADWWPAEAMIAPETGLPICIETTRHVVAAFHRAGVKTVQPMPCALYCYNREATMQIAAGLPHVKGAMRVEVTPETAKRTAKRGWAGHLAVESPQFVLDLVLPGVLASVGARGFDDVTGFCGEKGVDMVDVDGSWIAMTTNGLTFRYQPRPRLSSWRNTDAWRGPVDRRVVDVMTERIRELL